MFPHQTNAHLVVFVGRGPHVAMHDSRFFEEDVTTAHERLPLPRPETVTGVLLDMIMQALVGVAHPRVDELGPVLRRQVAVLVQARTMDDG